MKLVANEVNGVHLRYILPVINEETQVDNVLAAIAYGSTHTTDESKDLIGHTLDNKLRLDLWMRYDETVPVSVPFLKRLLKHQKDNVFTKFVPDCFHSKVIWWKGYGAYIGSANHTDRAWVTNIEAGLFITDDELISSGMDIQLEEFFDYLRTLDVTIPISPDYVKEMEELDKFKKYKNKEAIKARKHSVWEGPSLFTKKSAFSKRKENFKQEWLATLGTLKLIEEQVSLYRPSWVDDDVPTGWQVDQFLHAYYYNKVGEGLSKPYEEYYLKHAKDPNAELKKQLQWWSETPSAPSNEDLTFYENAPILKELLSKDKILKLTENEFEQVCRYTHATGDHVIKVPLTVLGKPELKSLDRNERFKLFAPLILKQRNKKNYDVRELLYYVLYEGADSDLWERLYNAGRNSDYTISRYGLNSIAEVVGWARPEVAPPRNGRTSKALKALGFDVKIY